MLAVRAILSLVLGVGPLLTLAAEKPILRDRLVSNEKLTRSTNEIPRATRVPFSSNLLSKRPTQEVSPQSKPAGQTTTLLPDGQLLKLGGLEAAGPIADGTIGDSVVRLQRGRAWHTATMLPNGSILIVGGIGANGQVVQASEIFNPANRRSELLTPTTLRTTNRNSLASITARVYHTATLLTEGLVLIVGGVSADGQPLKTAERWDFRNGNVLSVESKLHAARYNHAAELLRDGSVLFFGGSDQKGSTEKKGELFTVATRRFDSRSAEQTSALLEANRAEQNPGLTASLPTDGATAVPLDAFVALRFSANMRGASVNTETVTLSNSYGPVEVTVVPAEGGRLAFVTPKVALPAGQVHSLSIMGTKDMSGAELPFTSLSFSTVSGAPVETSNPEPWLPDADYLQADKNSSQLVMSLRKNPPLHAPAGVTALSGEVLKLNGQPLASVTIQIDEASTRTDETGRFLLSPVKAGHQVMVIHGHTANRNGKTYGMFEVGVDIKAGSTNQLPYIIWMPVIDNQHAARLSVPTSERVTVTTPLIPELEVNIPRNVRLRNADGEMTQFSVTPIPPDRPPFPGPKGGKVFFVLQTHGAKVESANGSLTEGVEIVFPNFVGAPPGSRVDLYSYDAKTEWHVFGQGIVSANGKRIKPDPSVTPQQRSLGCVWAVGNPTDAPAEGPPPGGCAVDGDPVDLVTGLFILSQTDIALTDVMPISLSRSYRPRDNVSRPFGIGATHSYQIYLIGNGSPYDGTELVLPDGGRLRYDRISPGTGVNDAVLEHSSTPTQFYKSRLTWNQEYGWDLTFKDGSRWRFQAYANAAPMLISMSDRNGNTISITRTSQKQVSKVMSPNGRWIEFSYDPSDRITRARDNIGRTANYTYDTSGRLWKVTNPMSGVTEYTYDSSNRITGIKNPRGIIYVTNEYDSNGRVSRQTHADGGIYQFVYTLDGNGKVTQTDVSDPRGNHRIVSFNSSGYVLTDSRTCCSGSITNERQFGTNIITSITDEVGHRTEFGHDSMGNVISVTRGAGTADAVTSTYSFESTFNELGSSTDPLGHSISFTHNGAGNITGVTDPLGNTYSFLYNASGQIISISDPLSATMQFGYDGADLVFGQDAVGSAGSAFTDSVGRVLSITDPLGQVTRTEYDALDRVTRITDPLQGATQLAYDANSNLTDITDARGSVTSYAYDNMDRLLSRTDPLGHVQSYQYDLNGNLTQVNDRKNQATSYSYDALNRLNQVQYADSSTTTYTYDAASRLTQLVDSISGTINYSYDTLDRVTSETTPQGAVNYTYDTSNRRTSMAVAGQGTISYTYDNANRVTRIAQGSTEVTISYDAIGRAISLTLPNGVITQYDYDAGSKLKGVNYSKGGVALGTLTYAYDATGKRIAIGGSFARTALPQSLASTSYDAANQQTGFGTQTLTYDSNGSLTSDGILTYIWDARDELLSIAGPGLSASFQYDGFGRRIGKSINGTTTGFLYDGQNVVQEQVSGVDSANMLVGGLDAVFARTDSSGSFSVVSDPLGSTIALTDSSGAIQTQYTYEPFGKTTTSGPSSGNPSQFTGRDNDSTGTYYYRARYYDGLRGRFLSEDPMGFAADVNFYAYVGNNPVNSVDPEGLDTVSVCCRPLFFQAWLQVFKIWHHCYIKIHSETASGAAGRDETWGILGDPGTTKNQIPRKGDGRNVGGNCKPVPGVYNSCNVETLRNGLDAATGRQGCPSCGSNYRLAFRNGASIDGFNSNTWVYNMLEGAGLIPPAQARAPGYHHAPGKWY